MVDGRERCNVEQEFLQEHWVHVVSLGRNVRFLRQDHSLEKQRGRKARLITSISRWIICRQNADTSVASVVYLGGRYIC